MVACLCLLAAASLLILPESASADTAPLTAAFHEVPSEHDGSNPFNLELRFSEDFGGPLPFSMLRDQALQATNGSVTRARRAAQNQNQRWIITVQPDSNEDVTVSLSVSTDCSATVSICTPDGRSLSNSPSVTVSGPSEDPPPPPPIPAPPTISSVAITSTPSFDADGNGTAETYLWRESIEVTVTWSSNVTWDVSAAGAELRLRLDVDGASDTTKLARLVTGGATSGTARSLVFRYSVVRRDRDTDGVYPKPSGTGNLVHLTSGATLRDAHGQNASRVHGGLSANANHQVDGRDNAVPPSAALAITTPGDKTYEQGEAITAFGITVTDADNDTLTVTVTGLPSGLSYTDGQVSGTVASDATAQDYTVTISADDGVNAAVTAAFTITVAPPLRTARSVTNPVPGAPTVTRTEFSTPTAPALDVTWTKPDSNGLTISWYKLQYRKQGGTWTVAPDVLESASHRLSNLEAGATYEVQVRAGTNEQGLGDWSSTGSGKANTPPAATGTRFNGGTFPVGSIGDYKETGQGALGVFFADADSDTLTYSAAAERPALLGVSLSGAAGSAHLRTTLLNQGSSKVTFTASDAYGGQVTRTTTINITAKTSRRIAENSPAGTAVGDPVTGTPYSDVALTYSLTGNAASSGLFVINSSTGQISVKQGATLDYETDDSYRETETWRGEVIAKFYRGKVQYTVDGNAAAIDVDIIITDVGAGVPAAPTVTRKEFSQPSNPALDVTWTAPDTDGQTITGYKAQYRKKAAEGADPAAWTAHSGTLGATATSLTLSDLEAGATYEAQVLAVTGAGDGPWSGSGEGTANRPPAATSTRFNGGTFPVGGIADYNETGPGALGVFFADADGDALTYSAAAQHPALLGVSLSGAAGEARLRVTLLNQGASTVTYTASDAYGGQVTRTTTIRISAKKNLRIAENSPAGTAVGDPVTGTPYNDVALTYSLTGNAASSGLFVIDSSTGQISVKQGATLDYETDDSYRETETWQGQVVAKFYSGKVQYTVDGNAAAIDVDIIITDVGAGAPAAPTVTRKEFSGPSNPALDVTWTAPDTDGQTMTGYKAQYRKKAAEGADPAAWTAYSGTLGATATSLTLSDLEAGATYEAQVLAVTSEGGDGAWSSTGEGTANRPPATTSTRFNGGTFPVGGIADYNETGPGALGVFFADADGDALTYSAAAQHPALLGVSLTGAAGEARLRVTLLNQGASTVTYTASDAYGGQVTRTTTIRISAKKNLRIAENSPAGTAVGDPVTGTPYDGEALTYSLTGNAASSGLFAIDSSTGQISVAQGATLDYETDDSYRETETWQGQVVAKYYSGKVQYTVDGNAAAIDVDIIITDVEAEDTVAPAVTIADASAAEGDSISFTVTLDKAVSGGLTVTPSFADGTAASTDYTANTAALSFDGMKGEQKTFAVATTEDELVEADETFTVSLAVSGTSETVTATGTANGTISNDDSAAVTIDDAVATEGETLTFTVTLDKAVQGGLTVTPSFDDVTATKGTDYTENTTALNFAGTAGEEQTFTVVTADDKDEEGAETFTISLTLSAAPPAVTANDTATGTISDEGVVVMIIDDASAAEGDALTFRVKLNLAVKDALTVTPSFTDVTATKGTDYTENTSALSFIGTAGEEQIFTVATSEDDEVEANETFTVGLEVSGASVIATDTATGKITNDDGVAAVTIGDASADEGEAISFTVTLDKAVSGGLTVTPSFTDVTATKGTDYTENTTALSFTGNAGERQSFTVATTEDTDSETNETFTVSLAVTGTSAAVTASDTAEGTITNDDVVEAAPPAAPTMTRKEFSGPSNPALDVTWTAPDTDGQTITGYKAQYRKKAAEGADPAAWTAYSGTLGATATSLTLSDLEAGATYEAQVLAVTSEGGDGAWSSTGEGTANRPPATTSTRFNGGTFPVGGIADYNETGPGALGVFFADADGDALTYSAAAQHPALLGVSLSGAAGEARLRVTLLNQGASTVTYTASDAYGGQVTRTTTIRISAKKNLRIAENSPAGTAVGDPVTGTPYNDVALTYSLTGNAASSGLFVIDSSTGQISVKQGATLDYETDDSYRETETWQGQVVAKFYSGKVQYTVDGNAAAIDVDIIITDVGAGAPAAPTVTRKEFSGPSNPALDVTWTAPDTDGQTMTGYKAQYRKKAAEGADPAAWTAYSGTLGATATSLTLSDLEAGATYEAQVLAVTSEGGDGAWSSTGEGTANRPPATTSTRFNGGTFPVGGIADYNETGPGALGVFFADADGDALTYSAAAQHPALLGVSLTGAAGEARLRVTLLNQGASTVTYTASDAYGGQVTRTTTIRITAKKNLRIAENSPAGTAVGDPVTGTPYDGEALTYSLTGNAASSGLFAIDSSTGQISVAQGATLDYETDDSYRETETWQGQVVAKYYSGKVQYTVDGNAAAIDVDIIITDVEAEDTAAPAVTIADASAAEGDSISFTVTLDKAVSGGLTVTPSFADGTAASTDYTANTAALSFDGMKGEQKTFAVATTEDELVEADETFTVGLAVSGTSETVTATGTATGTISNDDSAAVTIDDAVATEGETLTFTVTLDNAVQDGLSVTPSLTDVTATKGTDYVGDAAALTFVGTPDEAQTFTVDTVADDDPAEVAETFTVSLTLSSAPPAVTATDTATGTIADEGVAVVTIDDASASEGDVLTFTVKLNQAVHESLTVTPSFTDVSATKDTDYTENTEALSFTGNAGETQTLTVSTTEDTAVEATETFTVGLTVSDTSVPVIATDTATGTINNDDGSATVTIENVSAEEGDDLTFTVTLDKAVSDGFIVTPRFTDVTATEGTDYTENTTALRFAGNKGEQQTFTVATTEDTDDEDDETFTVSLAVSGNLAAVDASNTATGTITNDDATGVFIENVSAEEGDDLTFTVTLNEAVTGGFTVTPSFTDVSATKGTDYTENTDALTFTGTKGEQQTFTVTTTEDNDVEADETFTVSLAVSDTTETVGATDTATGTITNDDSTGVFIENVAAEEGNDLTFTVTLNEAVTGGLTVTPSFTDVSATEGTDYTENTEALSLHRQQGRAEDLHRLHDRRQRRGGGRDLHGRTHRLGHHRDGGRHRHGDGHDHQRRLDGRIHRERLGRGRQRPDLHRDAEPPGDRRVHGDPQLHRRERHRRHRLH